MNPNARKAFLPGLLLALAGCASVSPREPFEQVAKEVAARGAPALHWDQGTPADEEVRAHIRELVRGVLGPETAVEVALLRNQGLVATYEELGIAQADLVQAGLLRNPSVGARVRFPAGGGPLATDFSIAQDFLELFTLPLRKRVASAQLDASKARVAGAVLELAAQVRQAVVALQAAQATAQMRKLVLDAQAAATELRKRQRAAGNVGELDLLQEEAFFQQGTLEVARAEAQVLDDREHVNRLLGLWGEESASWRVDATLAPLPAEDPDLAHVESLAVTQRQDLAAARSEHLALEEAASLSGVTRVFPAIQASVSTERDAEGHRVTGPGISLELPLFDQGQARVARVRAQLRQAQAREEELAVNIRAEVRTLRNRLTSARAIAEHYRKVLLPLRERLVKEAQLRYNAMFTGVFQLLLSRREQIDAYRDYLEATRDYWTARISLERAAGGSLSQSHVKERP